MVHLRPAVAFYLRRLIATPVNGDGMCGLPIPPGTWGTNDWRGRRPEQAQEI